MPRRINMNMMRRLVCGALTLLIAVSAQGPGMYSMNGVVSTEGPGMYSMNGVVSA